MEDVIMTEIKEENKEISPIYSDYKKCIIAIDKALSLKDNKTLYLNFRQLNKFRKEFKDEDISYICDTILRQKYHFESIQQCNNKVIDLNSGCNSQQIPNIHEKC
jgi:hypothetical protein